ncbi:terminase small subunit [Mesorhizobium sp. J428]|uniref:terminase small subunit n=1 Tax=Mesorhizobium sp. J428 TaxID=2898440 RepID=UPI0021508496|nr:terminase small subunit [Mesorhizobium sp. J428]MCR5859714.1 terminase small subunit [Mesorhizobium sp. J428]
MQTGELTQSEIEDLVARHPLPEGVGDVVLNRDELAEALDVSSNTVTAWINAGMPVQQAGGNGKPYEFRLAHCHAWNQARKADEDLRTASARQAIAAMRLALVGGSSGQSIEALDPKQRREIIAAQIEDERFAAQRRQLMRRDDVRELTESLMMLVRDTMESAPDRVERVEAMPPKAVDAFVDVCDELLEEFARRIANFWDVNRENRAPVKRDLFDA